MPSRWRLSTTSSIVGGGGSWNKCYKLRSDSKSHVEQHTVFDMAKIHSSTSCSDFASIQYTFDFRLRDPSAINCDRWQPAGNGGRHGICDVQLAIATISGASLINTLPLGDCFPGSCKWQIIIFSLSLPHNPAKSLPQTRPWLNHRIKLHTPPTKCSRRIVL